jgi:hypothetical protein
MSIAFKAATVAMNVFDVHSTYKTSKDEGDSTGVAVLKTIGSQALWAFAPELAGIAMVGDIGKALVEGGKAYAKGYGNQLARAQNRTYRANFGGRFIDTQNAYTMRQRGLQAMEQSGMNIQQVLGSEARTYYRGL